MAERGRYAKAAEEEKQKRQAEQTAQAGHDRAAREAHVQELQRRNQLLNGLRQELNQAAQEGAEYSVSIFDMARTGTPAVQFFVQRKEGPYFAVALYYVQVNEKDEVVVTRGAAPAAPKAPFERVGPWQMQGGVQLYSKDVATFNAEELVDAAVREFIRKR